VLPLRNHVYRYYLYLPLMALAFSVAALSDAVLEMSVKRRGTARLAPRTTARSAPFGLSESRSWSWVAVFTVWLLFAWGAERVVHQMEVRPSPVYPGLRGDPIIDRALIAERAIAGLRKATIPAGTRLVFIMRERITLIARIVRGSGEQDPPTREVYPETNVRTSLFDGIGVRAMIPAVDSAEFALGLGRPDTRTRYAIYAPTGDLDVYAAAGVDSLLRSSWVMRW
jgi:hypothetical protein